jgi:hypothetical protein
LHLRVAGLYVGWGMERKQMDTRYYCTVHQYRAGIFKQSMGARNLLGIGYRRTGPQPGFIGWWNSFLGIDSWAPETFKNTGSVIFTKIYTEGEGSIRSSNVFYSCLSHTYKYHKNTTKIILLLHFRLSLTLQHKYFTTIIKRKLNV